MGEEQVEVAGTSRKGFMGRLTRHRTESRTGASCCLDQEPDRCRAGFTILRDPVELREAVARARTFEARHSRRLSTVMARYGTIGGPTAHEADGPASPWGDAVR